MISSTRNQRATTVSLCRGKEKGRDLIVDRPALVAFRSNGETFSGYFAVVLRANKIAKYRGGIRPNARGRRLIVTAARGECQPGGHAPPS
jgi:hypothetical protein